MGKRMLGPHKKFYGQTIDANVLATIGSDTGDVPWKAYQVCCPLLDRTDATPQGGMFRDAYITKLAQWYRFIKIRSVTIYFRWKQWQGPASTVAQDFQPKFYWAMPMYPATELFNLASEQAARQQGVKCIPIHHGQGWAVRYVPRVQILQQPAFYYSVTPTRTTSTALWVWRKPGWVDMNDLAQNGQMRSISYWGIHYAIANLQKNDIIEVRASIKYMLKDLDWVGNLPPNTVNDEDVQDADAAELPEEEPEAKALMEEMGKYPLVEDEVGADMEESDEQQGAAAAEEESKVIG